MARSLVVTAALLVGFSAVAQVPLGNADPAMTATDPVPVGARLGIEHRESSSLYDEPTASASLTQLRLEVPYSLRVRQVARFTLPFQSGLTMSEGGKGTFGMGDLLFAPIWIPAGPCDAVQYGLGPQLTFATATHDALGAGDWKLGAVGIMSFLAHRNLLVGAEIAWHDFARWSLTARPVAVFRVVEAMREFDTLRGNAVLKKLGGLYVRSSLVSFTRQSSDYVLPAGAGLGYAFRWGTTLANLSWEFQLTLKHRGTLQPENEQFFALTLQ